MASASLAVKVLGNSDALKTALANADAVVTATTDKMVKLSKSFDGSKLIGDAYNSAKALGDLGTEVGLTTKEAAKLDAKLKEAYEKAVAMGNTGAAKDLKVFRDGIAESHPALDQTNSKLDAIWGGMKSAAGLVGVAFSVGAVVSFTKSVFDAASAVKDNSAALGYSTEAFQRNKFAAEQSGGSVEAFTKAANKLNDNLAGGSDSTVAALNAVGLKFEDIRNMRPEDAWTAVTNAVGKVEDPMLRANAAQDLFGKGALTLLPGMIEGYDKLGAAATVMSDKTIERLEAAQDTWDAFWNSIVIHSADVIAAFTDIAGDDGHGGAMAGLAANYAGTTAQVLQNNRDMAESTKTLSLDAIDAEKRMGRAMVERVDVVIPKSKAQLAAEKKDAAERAAALKKSQDDVVRSQEDAWKDTLAAQKIYTSTAERENAEMFAQLERDQATDVKIAEQAWLDKIAAQKQYTDASKSDMDAFWKDIADKDKASVEANKLALAAKEKASHEGWGRIRDDASAVLSQVESRVADSVVSLIGHWSHWRSVSKEIWGEIKSGISQVLSDILQEFESRFIKGLINSLLGGKGGFTSAFSGILSTGVSAGSAAALPAAGAGGAASGAGFAASFTAAIGPALGLAAAAYGAYKFWDYFFNNPRADRHDAPDERTGYVPTPYDSAGRDPGNPEPVDSNGGMWSGPAAGSGVDPGYSGHEQGTIYAASGYSGMVNRPTRFMAGEAGPEHVQITPRGAASGGGNASFVIEINGQAFARGIVPFIPGELTRLRLS